MVLTSKLVAAIQLLSFAPLCVSFPTNVKNTATIKRSASELAESYDYVVIGGGQSGLVVANRLTEDPSKTVLVIEYGPLDNDDPSIINPPKGLSVDPRFAYSLPSVPQPGLHNRSVTLTAGAVVGGGSAVNGMFFDRGAREDYENWERLGNPGWDFDSLLPYFKKATNFTAPLPEIEAGWNVTYDVEAYGDGPIQATFPAFLWPGQKNQRDAWLELGVKTSTKGASGDAYGFFWVPTVEDPVLRTRSFARTGYHDVSKTRPNYHLLIEHKVLNISFSEGLAAEGVSFQPRNGSLITKVKATREVVLAAGAVHSPQILQRSGVGPRAVLESAQIPVKLDLPGVGQNFQDHSYGLMSATYEKDAVPNPGMLQTDPVFIAQAQELWDTNRTGPYTIAAGTSVVFLPLRTMTDKWASISNSLTSQNARDHLPPQYEGTLLAGYLAQRAILSERLASEKSTVMEHPFSGGASGVFVLQKPLSRGSLNLDPANPYGEPIVDFQTFQNPTDVAILVESFRYMRKWIAQPSLQALGALESQSTANLLSDAEIVELIRSTGSSTLAHPSGTNAMMPLELGGVVDSDLKVHGVKRLTIIDASIMPLIPSTHLCATVYAIAEKAADLIKARAEL